jgi:hypothetical protein
MRATKGFVLEQRRSGIDIADLLGRATHIDVDDVRAAIHVVARGLGHHFGVGAGDLDHLRLDFAVVVAAAQRLLRPPEKRIGRHHLRHRHARAQALAEAAEGPIGHPRHRRDNEIVPELDRSDFQVAGFDGRFPRRARSSARLKVPILYAAGFATKKFLFQVL